MLKVSNSPTSTLDREIGRQIDTDTRDMQKDTETHIDTERHADVAIERHNTIDKQTEKQKDIH